MALIKDILTKEKERTDLSQCGVVHLYREGTFLRAYEWSAWLCATLIHAFKVTHRAMKSVEGSVAFIGFPVTSLEKFMPEGSRQVAVDEKAVDLILPSSMVTEWKDMDAARQAFEQWKASCPLEEPKAKHAKLADEADAPVERLSMMSVMQSILAFPVESKSPIDCMLYLAQVKRQLAKLI